MKKKRILYVHFHNLQETTGGARRALQNLVGCMNSADCDTYQTGAFPTSDVPDELVYCMFINEAECIEIAEILDSGIYDTVFFDTCLYGDAVAWIKNHCPKVKIVVHYHNFEKRYFSDCAQTDDERKLAAFATECERRAALVADHHVFISGEDRKSICNEYGIGFLNTTVVPPALPDSFTQSVAEITEEPYVVFLGSSFFANNEAVQFLIDHVAPYVNKHILIVGKGMDKTFTENYENVRVLGFVPSLDKVMNDALAFISPVYSGSGSKIKIAEALMYGKFIISSELSLAGYDKEQMDVCVCKTPDDYICAINSLDIGKQYCPNNRELFVRDHEINATCNRYSFVEKI